MNPVLLHFFITAALLLSALGFVVVALVGFLGGFKELEPRGEDEATVISARRNPPSHFIELTVWSRRRTRWITKLLEP